MTLNTLILILQLILTGRAYDCLEINVAILYTN